MDVGRKEERLVGDDSSPGGSCCVGKALRPMGVWDACYY